MVEYAAGSNRRGPFPEEWGIPEGAPNSDRRKAWITEQIRKHAGDQAHRQLASRHQRLVNDLRVRQLQARKDVPR